MMSQSGYVTARETEIIRILRVLGEATEGFVVVGGYAVNALGQHRFSFECELATDRDNVPTIDATLLGEGYTLARNEVRPPIGVTIREYRKSVRGEPVSVTLFVETVVNTTTRGTWTYEFIQKNSVEAIVVGATDSTPARVAGRNLLVALKLHAGGTQDFGDVVMLSEGVDWKVVARFAACGAKEALIGQLESGIRQMSSTKFASDLKSSFAMRSDPTFQIKGAILGLSTLRTLVAQEKFRDSL